MGKYERAATTVGQQVDILFQRGLKVTNSEEVKQKLENIGYFKFKGYCFPFYDSKDHFDNNVTFEQVYGAYMLDQKMHMLLLSLIVRVETQIKSRLGNFLALKYDPLCYADDGFFRAIDYKTDFLDKISDDAKKAGTRNELYVKHYRDDYENTFPLWVVFEMCSLGTFSKFFSDLQTEDQKDFVRGTYGGLTNKRLENWLHYLTLARNCCAHNSRTFKRTFSTSPKFFKTDITSCPELRKATVFPAFYILRELCFSSAYYNSCIDELCDYTRTLENVSLNDWGFPEDWCEVLKK
ncbi:Abi family protein [Lactiplantibacillus songbeiensis]|uniref:Abi family protein n=1 Tax=Lactiplantibacillus songbeiensis TaxID=2559920 RepID=A0ABW4BZ52_9LACO|nr:Abi family protein [Lactiplantibacillus songbeiensis]